MSLLEIDHLVADFYSTISFKAGTLPDYDHLLSLFDEQSILINNSFGKPLRFTPTEYVRGLEGQVADGTMEQYMQRELFKRTDFFGKVAQRLSVYEYSFNDAVIKGLPKGMCFLQCIQTDGKWKIAAMIWNDENENYLLPEEYLILGE
ncbi:hypothetical protein MUY27_16030 [Mucilaginibacter sp. RS28]|uniref:Nuclear transport factor 2 family protein n=1 Tax=Mucilaginibacter straminoryzae TaxID=2932774 RepID=A0A9X1X522_9SPHI|nr:hypothetical protein [Mucilaginibacter straminoryzae]MCJ8211227.1 hypothetical protein [Mucilaginibacter straminoryzae]